MSLLVHHCRRCVTADFELFHAERHTAERGRAVVAGEVRADLPQLQRVCPVRELLQNVHRVLIHDVLQRALAKLLQVVDHELVRRLRERERRGGRRERRVGAWHEHAKGHEVARRVRA